MTYQIAEALHMSPGDVLEKHTAAEFIGWRLYWEWQSSERELAELKAKTSDVAQTRARR